MSTARVKTEPYIEQLCIFTVVFGTCAYADNLTKHMSEYGYRTIAGCRTSTDTRLWTIDKRESGRRYSLTGEVEWLMSMFCRNFLGSEDVGGTRVL